MINSNCGVLYMRIWRQFRHCKFDKNVVTFSGEKFEMWLHLSPPSRPAQPKKVGTRPLVIFGSDVNKVYSAHLLLQIFVSYYCA